MEMASNLEWLKAQRSAVGGRRSEKQAIGYGLGAIGKDIGQRSEDRK